MRDHLLAAGEISVEATRAAHFPGITGALINDDAASPKKGTPADYRCRSSQIAHWGRGGAGASPAAAFTCGKLTPPRRDPHIDRPRTRLPPQPLCQIALARRFGPLDGAERPDLGPVAPAQLSRLKPRQHLETPRLHVVVRARRISHEPQPSRAPHQQPLRPWLRRSHPLIEQPSKRPPSLLHGAFAIDVQGRLGLSANDVHIRVRQVRVAGGRKTAVA
jgi:hypothetical protein